ncbi:putative ribosome biogenesis protein ytm1 protein [Rosellinia necatrix]|uniref:Ribosome biogenesis protein YTM1 n=1 Tax=Rosellinia necatrix TaxID=77044 RepID=A0A1S7ULJ9_ROSNE|nr:putative ribosome biogenesis protein ytm1 protein [Rosellinia necatrix]
MLDTPSPIPFDFLINGEFLRTSLQEYLETNGRNAEETLTVQYVRSLIPPVYQASFEHDDWISAIDVLSATSRAGVWSADKLAPNQDRIVSAAYDGVLQIWDPSGKAMARSSAGGHTASAKAVKFLSSTQVASAGLDRTVRIWKYAESDGGLQGTLRPGLELYGHKASVDALDVHGPTGRVLSASADGAVGLWTTSKSSAPAAPASLLPGAGGSEAKRRKLSGASAAPQRGPLSMMAIHNNSPVTAVCFDPADASVAYSASQDHTIRTIDLTTSKVENVITTSHPLLALTPLRRQPGAASASVLLAAATTARHITLVDPRVSAAATSVLTLRGHKNMVSSVAAGPDNDYSLVSGSYDGTCRVWDLRSARAGTKAEGGGSVSEPVYVIERESLKASKQRRAAGDVPGRGAKVFGVVWDKTFGIVSAGEDKMVQINRGSDLFTPS